MGPGIFSADIQSYGNWQYQVFDLLCHQDPARSYNISHIPMAVCSRCAGIYGFLLIGWITLPVYSLLKRKINNIELNFLIIAILLNLIDVIGNFFEFWSNTHTSRFLMGSLLGFSIPLLLNNEFFTLKKGRGNYGK